MKQDCNHDIVTKYGVAECQNCGIEESQILNQNKMKQERKAWILLGSIFLVFILYTPKKQEKHESKVKIQYGNYERLPERYYELP